METIPRFFSPPKRSFFLFGPRGTGKSTWIGELFPDALRLDLLDQTIHRELLARPERLAERVRGEPESRTVVIDEVQRIPALLSVVHQLIEERRSRRFVLTGSSARKLRRGGVDLLAGRAVLQHLHAFMGAELGSRFRLSDALRRGLLPMVWGADDPDLVLRTYASLYLREEVQMEGLVRNVGNFARFLEAISFSHGAQLNIANVARECEVERKVVEGYLSILDDLLLSFRIPVFTRRARRELVVHPKFYLFDCGVYRSLRPAGPLDRPEEIEGAALEGLVAQHLRAWIDYGAPDHRLFFWRTRGGQEVDFVIYGTQGLWAIEVKNSGRVRPSDLRALRDFRSDYPLARTLLLYRGSARLEIEGIRCLPCEDWMRSLAPDRAPDGVL
jgi:predicted AAA+ superfamily ATPase